MAKKSDKPFLSSFCKAEGSWGGEDYADFAIHFDHHDELREILIKSLLIGYRDGLNDGLSQCASPIESAMLVALISLGLISGDRVILDVYDELMPTDIGPDSSTELRIRPQDKIDQYRIDFRVDRRIAPTAGQPNREGSTVLVECDGHDFHERTKEQASRDRKRDRHLQSLGHKVFRFTGSGI